jgi:glycosyltransferase involved in cell wall biosynthesis
MSRRPVILLNALATRAGGALNRTQQVARLAGDLWHARLLVAHHPRIPMDLPPGCRADLPGVMHHLPGVTHRLLEPGTLSWLVRRTGPSAVLNSGIYVPARLPPDVANILWFTSLAPWSSGPEAHQPRSRLRRLMFETTYRRATAVIVQSSAARVALTSAYPDLKGRVFVVHNGVRLPALDRPDRTRGFLLVGDLHTYRRTDEVLQAYASLPGAVMDEHPLTVVGDLGHNPRLARRLHADVARARLGSRVVLTGPLPRDAVLRHMIAARVFVSFAETENGPNAVAEAVGLGVPSILSDLPVHREYAGDGAEYVGSIEALTHAMTRAAGLPDAPPRRTAAIDTWPARVAGIGVVLENIGALRVQ